MVRIVHDVADPRGRTCSDMRGLRELHVFVNSKQVLVRFYVFAKSASHLRVQTRENPTCS
jgi:hypothetical protein